MGNDISTLVMEAKKKSYTLAAVSIETRNLALENIAAALFDSAIIIANENKKDIEEAKKNNLSGVMLKRLILDADKVVQLADSVKALIKLPDPLGFIQLERELDNGLNLIRKTVPIGLIGVIFESRPEAYIQIASLCIKSGNCAILKGGKEALYTNRILHDIFTKALDKTDSIFNNCFILAESREDIRSILSLDNYIDLMIPRGSNELVKFIKENTKIPVLGHADGICHLYIDEFADLNMAVDLTEDAKCQYPAVCNAIETLLVNVNVANKVLPEIRKKLPSVELRLDDRAFSCINGEHATEEDWGTEYNDFILSIKIVDSLQDAINHINHYGSHHSDAIVTSSKENAEYFQQNVDSASVMWNCSTRFADGFRYGFGAEVGISTNKIHARGPVGLEGLTIYKYLLNGNGQLVRPYAEGQKKFTHIDKTRR